MESSKFTVLKVTWVGMVANVALAVMKMICGIVAGSSALVADGLHSFSDLISDVVILVGAHYWSLPADAGHTHGHQKIEVFSSLIIGLILLFVGFGIVYDGFVAMTREHFARSAPSIAAYIATLIAIFAKEGLYIYTANAGKRIKSSALIANAWHHRSDAISSIPVLISLIVVYFFPNFWEADVIGSIVVSTFIFKAAWSILKDATRNLSDGSASCEQVEAVRTIILNFEGVRGVHNMRTRLIGSTTFEIDFHMEVDPLMTVYDANVLSHKLVDKLKVEVEDVVDVIIHVDPYRRHRKRRDDNFN